MRNQRRTTGSNVLVSLMLVLVVIAALGAVPGPVLGSDDTDLEADADRIHIDVQVDENGDAVWRVSYRLPLETEEDRAAFEDLSADIESDPSPYVDAYRERMETAAASAEGATGREMAIENLTVSAETDELPEPTGTVAYEFRWTNFADRDDGALVVGDAIDGMFLDEETSLLIGGPDEWVVESVSPEPSDDRTDAAVWRGPYEFSTGEPRVTLVEENPSFWATVGMGPILGGAVFVTLLFVGAWVVFRDQVEDDMTEAAASPDEEDEPLDTELLSNEEQVIGVLERHGGRMKQKELAEELDWTAAKTSQVTTDLRDEGRIEGFRLGRENVLKLPDAEE